MHSFCQARRTQSCPTSAAHHQKLAANYLLTTIILTMIMTFSSLVVSRDVGQLPSSVLVESNSVTMIKTTVSYQLQGVATKTIGVRVTNRLWGFGYVYFMVVEHPNKAPKSKRFKELTRRELDAKAAFLAREEEKRAYSRADCGKSDLLCSKRETS